MATLIIVVVVYMSVRYGERFLNEANISSVLLNAAADRDPHDRMTILMIGAAIDLSVGAVLGLAGVVAALLVKQYLVPVPVAFLVGWRLAPRAAPSTASSRLACTSTR